MRQCPGKRHNTVKKRLIRMTNTVTSAPVETLDTGKIRFGGSFRLPGARTA